MYSLWDILPQEIISNIFSYDSTFYDMTHINKSIVEYSCININDYEDVVPFFWEGKMGILLKNVNIPFELTDKIFHYNNNDLNMTFCTLTWRRPEMIEYITRIIENAVIRVQDLMRIISSFNINDRFMMVHYDCCYYDPSANLTYILGNKIHCPMNSNCTFKIKVDNTYEYNKMYINSYTRLYLVDIF